MFERVCETFHFVWRNVLTMTGTTLLIFHLKLNKTKIPMLLIKHNFSNSNNLYVSLQNYGGCLLHFVHKYICIKI